MKPITIIATIVAAILMFGGIFMQIKQSIDREKARLFFIQQKDVQAGYSLYYDRAKNGWVPCWHWTDIPPDTSFLVYIPSINYVQLYWGKPYAMGYPTRDSAVKIIGRHWGQILQDRKSHGK